MQENRIRRDIVEAGRRLWERGFVVSNTGNISVRLSADEVLITPTRLPKTVCRKPIWSRWIFPAM